MWSLFVHFVSVNPYSPLAGLTGTYHPRHHNCRKGRTKCNCSANPAWTNTQMFKRQILASWDMEIWYYWKNTCITFFGMCNHRAQWARWHELMCQFWKLWNRLIADEWKGQWERRWWSFFLLAGGAGHYFCELICEWFLQTYNVQCNFYTYL